MAGEVRLCTFAFLISVISVSTNPRTMPIKIVDEPSQYGFNFNSNNNNNNGPDDSALKMRVEPSPFSGPAHLERLKGKCFTMTTETYKYELCPFSNITQHEQSYRWNPYSGVLGVWQEWEIVNNSFVAMWMRNGDDCGSNKRREVKVILKCGKKEVVQDVTEPKTCSYELYFKTPLVCHNHSLLVYPTLNETLRQEWNRAYTDFHYQYTTIQGYGKAMRKIFQKAGYYVTDYQKKEAEKKRAKPAEISQHSDDEFNLLHTCNQEFKKLKDENKKLKEELSQLKDRWNENVTSTEEPLNNRTVAKKERLPLQRDISSKPNTPKLGGDMTVEDDDNDGAQIQFEYD